MGDLHCFRCGEIGHLRAQCPKANGPRREDVPEPVPAAAGPAVRVRTLGIDYNPPERCAQDVPRWASYARQLLIHGCGESTHRTATYAPWRDPETGELTPAEPGEVYQSEFRRSTGRLIPIHECRLRELAREQLAGHDPAPRQPAAALTTGPDGAVNRRDAS